MKSHNNNNAGAPKLAFSKILLWLLIANSCCFRLSTQQSRWLQPGQELVFSSNGAGANDLGPPDANGLGPVFINNRPANPTLPPFIPVATTPSPQFLQCFQRCPTTPEYNPICASNRQLYGNEQKFNCARACGADIQIVRRSSCEGLVQMMRG